MPRESSKRIRCAIYTRQSRSSNSDFSSCQAQFEICREFIQSQEGMGWAFDGLHYEDEGRSGENLDRPGLKQMLDATDSGLFDRIVVHRLDRLSRKVVDCASLLAEFREKDITLTIVSQPELGTSANDVLMINLLSSFAEFERELIRDRLAESRAAFKRQGRRLAGRVPYGYVNDQSSKQLVPLRSESRRVKAMFERAAKGETPRQIADHANRYGWRTKVVVSRKAGRRSGGNRWTPRQVLDTLSNPTYIGLVRSGDRLLPGVHEPLVTRELFDIVAAHIAERRTTTKGRSQLDLTLFPLRGVLSCGNCGRLMSPSLSRHGSRGYRYYRCRSHSGGRAPCVGVSLPAEAIERTICEMLASDDPTEASQENADHKAFQVAWGALTESEQRRLLPDVLRCVIYDPRQSTLSVTILPGVGERLPKN